MVSTFSVQFVYPRASSSCLLCSMKATRVLYSEILAVRASCAKTSVSFWVSFAFSAMLTPERSMLFWLEFAAFASKAAVEDVGSGVVVVEVVVVVVQGGFAKMSRK